MTELPKVPFCTTCKAVAAPPHWRIQHTSPCTEAATEVIAFARETVQRHREVALQDAQDFPFPTPEEICEERGHVIPSHQLNVAPRTYADCHHCKMRLRWVEPVEGHWVTTEGKRVFVVPGKGRV